MRKAHRRWGTAAVAAIVLVNVLALAGGIFLQHGSTRLPYDPTKSYAEIFGSPTTSSPGGSGPSVSTVSRRSRCGSNPITATRSGESLIHAPGPTRGTVLINGYAYAVMPLGDVFLDLKGSDARHLLRAHGQDQLWLPREVRVGETGQIRPPEDPAGTVGVYASSAAARRDERGNWRRGVRQHPE